MSLSADETASSPFFGSRSSETVLLPNFYLRLDFTDQGSREMTNKQKVAKFWKFIDTKYDLSSATVLSQNEGEPQSQSLEKITNKETKRPWTKTLKTLDNLGYKKVATAAMKSCICCKEHEIYVPNQNRQQVCNELCIWNREYRLRQQMEPQEQWNAYEKVRNSDKRRENKK